MSEQAGSEGSQADTDVVGYSDSRSEEERLDEIDDETRNTDTIRFVD